MNKIIKLIIAITYISNMLGTQFTNNTCNVILISKGEGAGGAIIYNCGHIGSEIQPGETKDIDSYYTDEQDQIIFWTRTPLNTSDIQKTPINRLSPNQFTYDTKASIKLESSTDKPSEQIELDNFFQDQSTTETSDIKRRWEELENELLEF